MKNKHDEINNALALMVYETWVLNGCSQESMPKLKLCKWCNKQLQRPLFPIDEPQQQRRHWWQRNPIR